MPKTSTHDAERLAYSVTLYQDSDNAGAKLMAALSRDTAPEDDAPAEDTDAAEDDLQRA